MKHTPVADVAPLLPNTICMTLTAVPRSSGMPFAFRYTAARGLPHDANTASTDRRSCSRGSVGRSSPVCCRATARNVATSPRRSSASRSVSCATPRRALSASSSSANACAGTPSTTSPYICTNRRYESHAKRGLPDSAASPSTDSSEIPRLRIVSIIPGIENTAPERTDTSSGRSRAPRRRPVRCSSASRCASTSSHSPSGHDPPRCIAATHAAVVTVKPSGTGTPMRRISATPAPLPPSRARMSARPSARS